jgi:Uma2 family endonuclease
MASTSVLIPVEEYLNSSYHPDCDYIDGVLKERTSGEIPHSKLQSFFCWYFRNRRGAENLLALPEQRVQVADDRYRIPDICLIAADTPDDLILHTPPILCIEILSREEGMTEVFERVDDYLLMGVAAIWIIDPWRREARSVAADGTLRPEPQFLQVPNSSIQIATAEIFRELDRAVTP